MAAIVDVESLVADVLGRHARRHVGVAVGVLLGEQSWVMGSGEVAAGCKRERALRSGP